MTSAAAVGSGVGGDWRMAQPFLNRARGRPGSARRTEALVDLIQTDAAISPGNPGGALAGRPVSGVEDVLAALRAARGYRILPNIARKMRTMIAPITSQTMAAIP